MLRYFFASILVLHGLIHLAGFVHAFSHVGIKQLTLPVSRPGGIIWLIACLLFLIAAGLLLLRKDSWWIPAIPALLLSQFSILLNWADARFGTIPNILILIMVIIACSDWRFSHRFRTEITNMLSSGGNTESRIVTKDMLKDLPLPVQEWLRKSDVVGKEIIHTVYMKQDGEMRLKPGGKWIPFEAEQVVRIQNPSFLWQTKITPSPFLFINGRDRLAGGNGNMLIKAYGLATISDATGDETDQASMMRFLAEIMWYPTAALSPYIRWQARDSRSARATMIHSGREVTGIFYFDDNGNVSHFESKRYYDRGKEKATLETWVPANVPGAVKIVCGMAIPYKSEITWKLAEGDFTWLRVELTRVKFNVRKE